jgi:hypothetical protein
VKDGSGPKLVNRSTLHCCRCPPGHHHADMFDFAKWRPRQGSDMLRPFPSRFISGPSDRYAADLHDFELSFFENAYFVGVSNRFKTTSSMTVFRVLAVDDLGLYPCRHGRGTLFSFV